MTYQLKKTQKKTPIFLFCLFLINILFVDAQILWCGSSGSGSSQSPSQGTGDCKDYLKDFIPNPTDPVLIIKVNFFIFQPAGSNGIWSGNTVANADLAIAKLNYRYSNVPQPKLVVPGVQHISDTRIRFVRNSFQVITNSTLYTYLSTANNIYNANDAINVYYGDVEPGVGCPKDVPIGEDYVHMRSCNGPGQLIDDDGHTNDLAHEFGHVFGLTDHTHSVASAPYNNRYFINPGKNCCGDIVTDDYQLETNVFHASCEDPNPLTSNNMMSGNSGCNRYFSPLQMAIMHYHLRFKYRNYLTAQSKIYPDHKMRGSYA